MNTNACGNSTRNPISPCGASDGMIKRAYFIERGKTFTDQADAALYASHQTKIQNGEEIVFPSHLIIEDRSTGVTNEQTTLGIANVSQGTVEHALSIVTNFDLYKRTETFTGSHIQYDVFYQTDIGKLIMRKNPDGTYGGFSNGFTNIENPSINDGSVTAKAIMHVLIDTVEWRTQAVAFTPEFSTSRLQSLSDVEIEVIAASATEVTFKVNKFSDNINIQNANPVYALDETDIDFLDASGSAQTIGSFTTGSVATSGVYTITGTGLVTGIIDLKAPSLMTTSGYNSVGAATVTIP